MEMEVGIEKKQSWLCFPCIYLVGKCSVGSFWGNVVVSSGFINEKTRKHVSAQKHVFLAKKQKQLFKPFLAQHGFKITSQFNETQSRLQRYFRCFWVETPKRVRSIGS